MSPASRTASLLGPSGPLASRLPGFAARPQQQALAAAIEQALAEGRPCLAEAGTGVGKTLAYLVPLVRWLEARGGRAIVSTHTLALQSQLIERDIPLLLSALESPIEAAVLKGRLNFLCLQDLEVAAQELWTAGDPLFQTIQRWSNETQTGDVAELDFAFPGWSDIAANPDTCRQRDCRFFDRCFYYRARRHAEGCQLLVVNHALFFADLRLRLANPAAPSLLPDYDAVVFDEAHHVDDMATRAFGLEWSAGRVPRLVARARRFASLPTGLLAAIEALHNRLLDPFLGNVAPEGFLHEALTTGEARALFAGYRDELRAALETLARELSRLADSAASPVDRDRATGLSRIAGRIGAELGLVAPVPDEEPPPSPGTAPPEAADAFSWYQVRRGRGGQPLATLLRTPYTIAGALADALFGATPRTAFVSATLATHGGFGFLQQRLGLDDAAAGAPIETVQGSPFDFDRNALLYVPRHLGPPDASDAYAGRALEEIAALIDAARGRTFALFTSHRMLARARERLPARLAYPVLSQGEMPNARLVDAFKAAGDAVLLGTYSFWEGVDIPGPALSLVILDKLPFATPDTPPQRAREQRIQEAGGDPFAAFSLPQAQLRLKQGFGRLLRTASDRGVVAILDARLWTKNYGRQMLADLPPCPRTHRLEDVRAFFDQTSRAA